MSDGTQAGAESAAGVAGRPVRSWRPVAVVSAVVVAVALAGSALGVAVGGATPAGHPSVPCAPSEPKLTVQGAGQAMVTPNVLTVSVSVNATGPTAAAALDADNLRASAAIAAFRGGGVQARDIQTSGLSLQPQYVYPKGTPVLIGYQVTNAVTATLRHVAQAGAVIDAVVGSAGNALQIQSLTFSAAKPGVAEDLARSRADAQAAGHARALARSAGTTLGPVCSLTDQSVSPASGFQTANGIASSTSAAPSVPIEAGSQTVSAQISIVYALMARPVAPRAGRHGQKDEVEG
jgi:uncharacterized protein